MDVKQIRKKNLRWLIRNEADDNQTRFAEKVGTDPAYLSQILGKRGTRNIGDPMARRIEAVFQKQRGWLDMLHNTSSNDEPISDMPRMHRLTWNERLLKRFLDLKEREGLTMEQFAEQTGFSKSQLLGWMYGNEIPDSIKTNEILANALRVQPAWLAFGVHCSIDTNKIAS